MLHEEMIDVRMIARWLGTFYLRQWEKWGPYIKQVRSKTNNPRLWCEAEYMYDRLVEFAKRNPDYSIIPQ